MGSYVSAAEPPPVTQQPPQSEAWLEEAARQLAERKRREELEKLSECLRQGCFKRAVSIACLFIVLLFIFFYCQEQNNRICF